MRLKKAKKKRAAGKDFLRSRAGNAGVVASLAMALFGIGLGGTISYNIGRGAGAEAASVATTGPFDLRDAPLTGGSQAFEDRDAIIERVVTGGAPERLAPPAVAAGGPRIIVIFDDMGLDHSAFEEILRLPGPVTFSFLPYANGVQSYVTRARQRGDAVMLHLPMEPSGDADPGPHALKVDMIASDFLDELNWNLGQFTGYIAVNNHMGSRLTRDEAWMKTVLSVLNEKGLFFIDSLTTGKSIAAEAGRAIGAKVYARDVFLDPGAGRETVMNQLALVERIAIETGFAVAICHPRRDTLDIIGPWLTSAPTRGFRLDTVASLPALEEAWRKPDKVAAR